MPELPEVETIRRVLGPQLRGLKIQNIRIETPPIVAYPQVEEFSKLLTGQVIASMSRRGKFLLIHMNSGDRIVLHLRMTGCLLVTPANAPMEKHTHLVFELSGGKELRFSDTRRFGRFWFLQDGEADVYSGIGKLGLEPLDTGLDSEYLKNHFGKRKRAIKTCLLEQSVVAGIGNIYSDEILFQAKICPAKPAEALTEEEWTNLAKVIPEQIRYFIGKNAITEEEYLEGRGKEYRNTPFLRVYGHGSEKCPECGEMLKRMVIAGRSSVFCVRCQGGGH